MRPPTDGVASASARAASHKETITELRVTLRVTLNGRPVPTKSDGARFPGVSGGGGGGSGGGGGGAAPLDVTLKLRQGARYCFSLSCVAPTAPPSAPTCAVALTLESDQATVWTRCARQTPPAASAAGLHDVLGLLCCCGGADGVDGGDGGAAAGGRPGRQGDEGLALVGAGGGGRMGGGADSASGDGGGGGGGGGPDDDGGGAWSGGAQVPVVAAKGGARFELFWCCPGGDEIVTADGTRTEVCVELIFAAFGRARLCLLCKIGPSVSGSSGGGGGAACGAACADERPTGGGGALRPSGARFHLLRSAMTGEVRVLSRVPL